jgi:hypothetical protein
VLRWEHPGLRKSLQDVAARAKPGSTLLIYYAGHGGMLDGGKDWIRFKKP